MASMTTPETLSAMGRDARTLGRTDAAAAIARVVARVSGS